MTNPEVDVEWLRRIAVWVAALYWVVCLAHHVLIVATQDGPRPGSFFVFWFLLTAGLAVAVSNIVRPIGPDVKYPAVPWYIYAIGVTALVCGLWPMAVGSGVPNTAGLRSAFDDTGVPGGPPGERSLNSHGRQVRALTEDEYDRATAWEAVRWTGAMAGFSGMTLAGALYFRRAWAAG